MKRIVCLLLYLSMIFTAVVAATPIPAKHLSWQAWVSQVRQEAIADGIDPVLFDQVFQHIKPDRKTIRYEKQQPEKRLTFNKYRTTRGDAYRVKLGIKTMKKNHQLLTGISQQYGVSPCMIVALWGLETSYGHYMGNFSTIKSLATLSYQSKRHAFFHKELLLALHILNEGHIDNAHFKGEWAGASGQPQFLPSSWYHYAVDYDGDGKKDIWTSTSDVLASIANYMKENGWHSGEPWAYEVTLPPHFDTNLIGKQHKKSIQQWTDLGVRLASGQPLPGDNIEGAIIKPYGGPYLLIFNNFRVIMRYNNSSFYAGTVSYMADQFCASRSIGDTH